MYFEALPKTSTGKVRKNELRTVARGRAQEGTARDGATAGDQERAG